MAYGDDGGGYATNHGTISSIHASLFHPLNHHPSHPSRRRRDDDDDDVCVACPAFESGWMAWMVSLAVWQGFHFPQTSVFPAPRHPLEASIILHQEYMVHLLS